MINKLKKILNGISSEIAKGMIIGNMIVSNGGSVIVEQVPY